MDTHQFPTSSNAVIFELDDVRYEFFDTDDGSPTVRRSDATQRPEAMHHCGGALTESLYIYGEAVQHALREKMPMRIISVGLGLAYNEMLAVAIAGQNDAQPNIEILSFENDPYLRKECIRWLEEEDTTSLLHQTLTRVLTKVAEATKVTSEKLKNDLQKMLREGRWVIHSDVRDFVPVREFYHVILFDAFSKKATPDLWSEEFILQFLKHYVRGPSVFATYAFTGSGRRALQAYGYQMLDRAGFQGKRQSTFAVIASPLLNFAAIASTQPKV